MLVSVIIPTYNSAGYLADAIDSALAQTFKDIEVLVIDDGSTDGTKSLMNKYGPPVRYIRQENSGVAAARNRGIEQSRGRYVAFLDADDTWFPNKLEAQVSALGQNSEQRLCYSAFSVVASDLTPIGISRSARSGCALEDLLLRGNVIGSICTVLCERSLFEITGGFDPALSQCADWDMWVRLAARSEFVYLDEPLVTYRQHNANMSRNAPLLEQDSMLVLEKGFAIAGLSESIRAQRRAAFARNFMVLAGTYFHARRFGDSIRCAACSLSMDLQQLGYLIAFPKRLLSRLTFKRAED